MKTLKDKLYSWHYQPCWPSVLYSRNRFMDSLNKPEWLRYAMLFIGEKESFKKYLSNTCKHVIMLRCWRQIKWPDLVYHGPVIWWRAYLLPYYENALGWVTKMIVHAQLCLTLCDSMDCSPPGSSVHGIFLARILKWVAIPSSKGSSRPREEEAQTWLLHFMGL